MEVVASHCCGLDVHKKTVVAGTIVPGPDGTPSRTTRTFGTMRADLERLAAWLQEQGVTHVAMESTGVYGQPVSNVLEDRFPLLLANAQQVKAVPGRKTDVQDAQWLAQLLRHGLIRGSFVPDRAQRELRELPRYRTALSRERATAVQRLAKTLAGGSIKLSAVVSDLQGVSARAMVQALTTGVTDPEALAALACGKLRAKQPALQQALDGQIGPHQRFLLPEQLAHLAALDERIAHVSAAIAERLRPFEAVLTRLDAVPGIGRWTAEGLLAEVGTDLRRFPTAKHLAAWAGLAPGNRESAGQRRPSPSRHGDRWLRALLVESARAAGRMRHGYPSAQYRRLAARRGANRAAVAVAHTLLVIISHLLTRETASVDLGDAYLDQRDRERTRRRAVARLERLGYQVALTPTDTAA
jgi:transposase